MTGPSSLPLRHPSTGEDKNSVLKIGFKTVEMYIMLSVFDFALV